jgi:hypothetical protein
MSGGWVATLNLAGMAVMVAGLWMIWPPLGVICTGLVLCAVAGAIHREIERSDR